MRVLINDTLNEYESIEIFYFLLKSDLTEEMGIKKRKQDIPGIFMEYQEGDSTGSLVIVMDDFSKAEVAVKKLFKNGSYDFCEENCIVIWLPESEDIVEVEISDFIEKINSINKKMKTESFKEVHGDYVMSKRI